MLCFVLSAVLVGCKTSWVEVEWVEGRVVTIPPRLSDEAMNRVRIRRVLGCRVTLLRYGEDGESGWCVVCGCEWLTR